MTSFGSRASPELTLGQILEEEPQLAGRIREMYLAAYARYPTSEELARWVAFCEEHRARRNPYRKPLEDLFYGLLISGEFLSNH